MKRILYTAAFLLTATLTFAQAPVSQPQSEPSAQHHAHNPHKAAMRMSKELGLSSDQETRLEPVLADQQQKVQAVRANASLTDLQRKQQMKQIHQSSRMQMSSILSPDQMKQLRTMRRDRKAQRTPTGV